MELNSWTISAAIISPVLGLATLGPYPEYLGEGVEAQRITLY